MKSTIDFYALKSYYLGKYRLIYKGTNQPSRHRKNLFPVPRVDKYKPFIIVMDFTLEKINIHHD